MSEGAGCHVGVTWSRAPGTPMGPLQGVVGWPLACQMLKWGAKLALAEGSKQQQEAFCKQLLDCPLFRAPQEKNATLGP